MSRGGARGRLEPGQSRRERPGARRSARRSCLSLMKVGPALEIAASSMSAPPVTGPWGPRRRRVLVGGHRVVGSGVATRSRTRYIGCREVPLGKSLHLGDQVPAEGEGARGGAARSSEGWVAGGRAPWVAGSPVRGGEGGGEASWGEVVGVGAAGGAGSGGAEVVFVAVFEGAVGCVGEGEAGDARGCRGRGGRCWGELDVVEVVDGVGGAGAAGGSVQVIERVRRGGWRSSRGVA